MRKGFDWNTVMTLVRDRRVFLYRFLWKNEKPIHPFKESDTLGRSRALG